MPLGGHGAEMLRSIRKNKAQLRKREGLYDRERDNAKISDPLIAGKKQLTEDQLFYLRKNLELQKRKQTRNLLLFCAAFVVVTLIVVLVLMNSNISLPDYID